MILRLTQREVGLLPERGEQLPLTSVKVIEQNYVLGSYATFVD